MLWKDASKVQNPSSCCPESGPPSGEFLRSGLWAWSRHPNYLGEMGFWWGLYLFGLVLLLVFFFFGSKKIPMIGRGLGSAIRNFKGELREGDDSSDERLLKDAPDTDQR